MQKEGRGAWMNLMKGRGWVREKYEGDDNIELASRY
jgi:hypothetical protein